MRAVRRERERNFGNSIVKTTLAVILMLTALPLAAQTSIPIQNPSFDAAVTWQATGSYGSYEYGNVPGWTLSAGASGGVQSLSSSYFTAYPNSGNQGLFLNSGSVTQDLGVSAQPNTNYSLTFYVGHRLDNANAVATAQLFIGTSSLCALAVNEANIPAGTFAASTLTCPTGSTVPTGDLIIWLGTSGTQANFDALSLTSSPVTQQHHATLTWADTVNPSGTTYNVYRAQGGCPTTFSLTLLASNVAKLGSTPLIYVDPTVTNAQNYCYGVTAVFDTVESLPSLTVYIPQQPSNLVVQ